MVKRRSLRRLIIFTAHEKAGCVHAVKLSPAPDNACPTQKFIFGANNFFEIGRKGKWKSKHFD
jgi:hypothetical protein